MVRGAGRLLNRVALALVRPYTRRELPGWGRLYRATVGGFRANDRWAGYPVRWIRGKVHDYEMRIDLASWSNREAFFVGRFFDTANQLIIKAVLAPGDTFVDIGANEGMIALMGAHAVGPTGKVIAFEPNPRPRAIFGETVLRNRLHWVDIRPVGLSDRPAVLPLTVPAINSGEGSFGRPSYESDQMEVVDCAVKVADDELAAERPRLVKIDVEGFELHVLAGLGETIARAKPIIVLEMITRHLANAGTTPEAIATFLVERGYRGWKLKESGRGATLRTSLAPPELGPDLWDDFLWIHRDDPLLDEIEQRLARTGLR